MRLQHVILAAAFVALPHAAAEVSACQCRARQPPCAQVAEADAVFVGSVVGITRAGADDDGPVFDRVRFRVERAFRGVEGESVELLDRMTSCRYGFAAGKSYLVYAYLDAAGDTLSTHACSRTAETSEAGVDLAYLGELPRRRPRQEIFGVLGEREQGLSGVAVVARRGKRRYHAASNERGWFRLTVPSPGRYRLTIALPHDADVMGTSEQLDRISRRTRTATRTILEYVVDVPAGRCAFVDVPVFRANRARR